MALTKVSRGLLTTSIVDNGNDTAITIDSSENVGIGNSNPSAFNSLGATDKLVIGDSTVSNLTLFGTNYGSLAFADSDTSSSTAQYAGLIQYYHADNSMQFYTNSTERMRIDSEGQVGVSSRKGFRFGNNQLQGNAGSSGGGYPSIGYNIRFTETAGDFGTLVGDTSWRIDIGDNARLQVHSRSSAAAVASGASYTAGPYVAINGTSWTGGSDERLKENVSTITGADAIAKVKAMRPVNYSWVHDSESANQLGFIAQEMALIVPEVVDVPETDTDAITGQTLMWGITYDRLIPLLTSALQEALTKIETLEAKVQTLENN